MWPWAEICFNGPLERSSKNSKNILLHNDEYDISKSSDKQWIADRYLLVALKIGNGLDGANFARSYNGSYQSGPKSHERERIACDTHAKSFLSLLNKK